MISFRFRYFAVEGYFAEVANRFRPFSNLAAVDNGQGWRYCVRKSPPCDCGRRETTRDVLTLNYEDDMYSKFHYYVEGNSMTLTTERGENQLWNSG